VTRVTFTEHGDSVSVEIPDERWVEACNMARARIFPAVPMKPFDAEAQEQLARRQAE